MKILRPVLYVLLILVGAFALFLLYATVDNYRPDEITLLDSREVDPWLTDSSDLTLLNWNIGYAGLDASMDFFYDGGDQMRPSKDGVEANMKDILETLSSFGNPDFLLLQEVDRNSKRSYYTEQYRAIADLFPEYSDYFGKNYDVFMVPIPVSNPMGKVESGLMSLSKHPASRADRYSFPGNYSWPMSLFMLDRCFLVKRYPLKGGKDLLVVNTHNSAYDDGSLRKMQMDFMKDFLLSEYARGNYVIVGGDWNQTPYGFAPEMPGHEFDTINLTYIEKDYPEASWTWAFDTDHPTNRRVAVPYNPETSLTTVIDYYLLSPNISLKEIRTIDLDFRSSDHQPVLLRARLVPL